MRRMILWGIFFIMVVGVTPLHFGYAQGASGVNSVTGVRIDKTQYANFTAKNGDLIWGVRIESSGDFSRTKDETIYFVIEDGKGNRKALCKFDGGEGLRLSGPNFPECFSRDSSKLFKHGGKTYGIVDILQANEKPSVYFSSDINGASVISTKTSLPPVFFNQKIVENPTFTVQEKDGKSFYDVKGVVAKNGVNNQSLYFDLLREGDTKTILAGKIPFQKGPFSFQSPPLASGKYILKVYTLNAQGKRSLQVLRIPTAIAQSQVGQNENNNPGVSDPFEYTDEQQSIIDGGIVPTDCGYNLGKGGRMCTFADFIKLIKRAIEYIFILMIPIAAIVIAYAGYLILFSGGDTNKVSAARNAIKNLFIGIAIFMLAWFIVRVLLNTLGVDDSFNLFFGK